VPPVWACARIRQALGEMTGRKGFLRQGLADVGGGQTVLRETASGRGFIRHIAVPFCLKWNERLRTGSIAAAGRASLCSGRP
jgi:hypothetical protein